MLNKENMSFHVNLVRIKQAPAFGPNGELAFQAKFHVNGVSGGPSFNYEGNAMGQEFQYRCAQLIERGGITVKIADFSSYVLSGNWQEKVVNYALDQVASV